MEIFVIGNGPSRAVVDLHKLKQYGKIYGCNALYRDFTPDMLFCVDAGMYKEITNSKYEGNIHTQVNPMGKAGASREQRERRKSSGGLAMQQAARDTENSQVYMLGFDNPRNTRYMDANIYAGSKIYVRNNNWGWKAFETDYIQVLTLYKHIKFINVINPELCNDMMDTLGVQCPNYSIMEYKDFPFQDCILPPPMDGNGTSNPVNEGSNPSGGAT